MRMEIGIRGRWQTGNLNQLALNPNANLLLSKNQFKNEFQVSYQYLKANDLVINSDLWTSAIFQYQPNKLVYPTAIILYGYSKSYRIDHSLFSGIGAGINIRNKSSTDLIQLNVFAGYMDVEFESEDVHSSVAGGMLLKSMSPITKHINVILEIQSYHSASELNLWGMRNMTSLRYHIHNNIFINATHHTIYNNQPIAEIKKANTIMLFGISYQQTNK